MFRRIEKVPLIVGGVGAIICGGALFAVQRRLGIRFMDSAFTGEAARNIYSDLLSRGHTATHAWATGTLDMAFPICYGAVLIGLARRHAARWTSAAVSLACLGVACDVIENVVEIIHLTTTIDWLGAKTIVTPIKYLAPAAVLGLVVAGCTTNRRP